MQVRRLRFARSASATFLLLLLAADVVFIAVHLIHILLEVGDSLYSIHDDRSYSEMFEYTKAFWIVILLILLAINTSSLIYLGWALIFVYLGIDNSMQLHELGGSVFVYYSNVKDGLGLRGQDFGELAIYALTVIVLLPIILILYFRSSEMAKRATVDLLILLGLLAFFGVFVDMLDIIVQGSSWSLFVTVIDVIEDAGELIVLSLTLGYVFRLLQAEGRVDRTLIEAFFRRSPDATPGAMKVAQRVPGHED